MKIIERSLFAFAVVFMLIISMRASAQKIEIGMTKAQLAKAFPAYAKEFNAKKASADFDEFYLHGMSGEGSFHFANGKLFLFDWQHYKSGTPIDQATTRQYVSLVQKLRSDWGPGAPKPSVYNMDVLDCTWTDPHWSASIKYSPMAINVQLIDLDVQHRLIGR
jgi:hypothetical protein